MLDFHKKHYIYFLILGVLMLGMLSNESQNNLPDGKFIIAACLFLILTIGISHGSLDNHRGYKLLKIYGINNKLVFYLSYIFLALLIIILWNFLPLLTLIIFLLVASYHFGKEDTLGYSYPLFDSKKKSNFLEFFLSGLPVILAPLSFHFELTLDIFKILYINNDVLIKCLFFLHTNFIFKILLLITLISGYFFKEISPRSAFYCEKISIIFLNIALTPLVAFTLYFCFLHSIRHSISLADELNKNDLNEGFKEFLNKALPLSLVTAILFIVSIYFLTNYYVLYDAILKVIFIGLASLTFPHILLEYLIKKNEK